MTNPREIGEESVCAVLAAAPHILITLASLNWLTQDHYAQRSALVFPRNQSDRSQEGATYLSHASIYTPR